MGFLTIFFSALVQNLLVIPKLDEKPIQNTKMYITSYLIWKLPVYFLTNEELLSIALDS